MKKVKAIWELLRLEHGVMIAIAILIGSLIALKGEGFPPFDKFILTFFTALFLEASTFALNDYYDLEIDKKNKRTDRPLARGDISPRTALYSFFILFPLGIISSFFVNTACFIIALITALLAILYDAKMKKIKLVGNFYIAYVMAIPFIFGGAAVLERNVLLFEIDPAIYIIALIAFFAGSGREIMKDVMDFEGDVKKGVKSFPKYIGERKSNILSGFFFLIAIFLSFLPFTIKQYQIYYLNYSYLFLVFITDVMLLSTSFQLIFKKKPNLKIYRSFTLFAIFIGLIAFLIPIILKIIGGAN
jgi:geranylgeranylglycerol-phosphate geranylgeranyltransferase